MKFNRSIFSLLVFAFALALPNAVFAQILPTDILQNGYAVYSCRANDDANVSVSIRKLGGIAGAFNNPNNLGDVDSSSQFQDIFDWNRGDFDGNEILGVTFDSRNGRIYAGASRLVSGQTTLPGVPSTNVYTISPDGNTVELLATLPGEEGTGWIDIDEEHNQLYVSNIDDGVIYVIDLANGVNQTGPYTTYAPFPASPIDGLLAPEGARIAGVGYNHVEKRLYYSVWGQTGRDQNLDNTLRSVAINPDGTFLASSDRLEFTSPNQQLGLVNTSIAPVSSAPIFDIDFDTTGTRLLIAERDFDVFNIGGVEGVTMVGHGGRVFELNGSTGAWVAEPTNKHSIGQLRFSGNFASLDTNSTGGVSFAPQDIDINHFITGQDTFVAALGEGLPLDNSLTPPLRIYGIQYHPITGGDITNSLKIDLDNDTLDIDKGVYFDIDVRSTPYDFGDLPDVYGTLTTSSGAAHGITSSFLGAGVDQEVNGNPSSLANGEGADDDGVVFLTPLVAGTTAKIQVTASTSGFLNPFFDFDGDGTLERATIVSLNGTPGSATSPISNTDIPLLAGMNMFIIQVPANATGNIPSRFRFSMTNPNGQLGSTGAWLDGEVEDYILSSLSGRVFNDNEQQDGLDLGDPGIENFLVKLLDSNGNPVLDASGNPITTLTDIDGNYSFAGLVPGDVVVQFMIMDSGVFTVENAGNDGSIQSNANTATGLTSTFAIGAGDSIPNVDAGILTIEQFSTLWNGFCDQGNFLTLNNNCDVTVDVRLELIDRDGSFQSAQNVKISPNRSTDVSVDQMPGFSTMSYGTIRASATPRSCITGTMSLWTPGTSDDDPGTVFQTPLTSNLSGVSALSTNSTGTTFAIFNTFNPSLNPADANIVTEHWLQLANLDASSSQTFTVERFNNDGTIIAVDSVVVGPSQRMDIAAGHQDSIINRYGIVRITPSDASLQYNAQLFRYGRDGTTVSGERMTVFSFADSATSGSATAQYLPVSNGANAVNWLEINNVTGGAETVSVDIFSNTLGLVSSQTYTIQGLNALHVPATTGLGIGESGVAVVTPLGGANIYAKSTSYFYRADGRISAAYSTTGTQALGTLASGGYNTFLDQFNWLRMFNTSSAPVTVTVNAFDSLGVTLLGTQTVTLNSMNGMDLDVNGVFSLPIDTVGQLEITSSVAGAIVADVLRIRYLNNDFSTVFGAQSYLVN